MLNHEIMVSVICNAYNHEKYIRKALDGFLMQKTNFKFEVLVHDDASTDGTADIIREYEIKYPDVIKPIYQTENQYSKGDWVVSKIQISRVRGKYTAVCEGDDYWTDPLKLQKQFDLMELNPGVDMCAHAARIGSKDGLSKYIMPSKKDCLFTPQKVIAGGGGFVATASLFYKSELNQSIPKFREMINLDYTLQIHGSLNGGILYLADCMSVYRVETENSWTKKMISNVSGYLEHKGKVISSLEQLNVDTKNKYKDVIGKVILKNKSYILYLSYIHNINTNNVLKKELPYYMIIQLYIRWKLGRVKTWVKRLIRK